MFSLSAPIRATLLTLLLTLGFPLNGNANPWIINVKEFGAVGDGVHDDTAAVQRAVEAAKQTAARFSSVGSYTRMGNALAGGAHPDILFPEGTYRITRPIVIEDHASVRGEGNATIRQDDPTQSAFYFHTVIRARVRNLGFSGGRTQLEFWTKNRNAAFVLIEQCRFTGAAGYAIECLSFTQRRPTSGEGWAAGVPWAPYELGSVSQEGQITLTPNRAGELSEWFNSTLFSVRDCDFKGGGGFARLQCDTAVIADCSLERDGTSALPAFDLEGKAHLERLTGVAKGEKEQLWIAGNGLLSFRHLELTAETPQAVRFFKAIHKKDRALSIDVGSFTLLVEESRIAAAGGGALISLIKENHPNLITVRGVEETSGLPLKAISHEETPTDALLRQWAGKLLERAPLEQIFQILLDGNSANLDTALPESIAFARQEPVSAAVREQTALAPVKTLPPDTSDWPRLDATQHGVVPAPGTDSTQALQRLFDLAAEKGPAVVTLPGAAYLVSETITLPSRIKIEAHGLALLVQADPEKPLFRVEDARQILFEGCHFTGGSHGIIAATARGKRGSLSFDYCTFYDQGEVALSYRSRTPPVDNLTQLQVSNTLFLTCRQGVVTNAARTDLSVLWTSNNQYLNEQAFIENRGGGMRIFSMLGVPRTWWKRSGKARQRHPHIPADWPYNYRHRWIDNWGKLAVIDTRFGGEGGGICGIYHRAEGGSVSVKGGFARFYNNATLHCTVYFEKAPRQAVLSHLSGLPWPHLDGKSWMGAEDLSTPPPVHREAVMIP